ncbi:MAG: Holliday junction branch migration protein RuvA [Chitinophagales bacterium]|nr:Holliday junction branch migration protein RuvA [Chitinophagales bacterium]MDW8393136.1 Holliday junction branch migration protein RuvA [Chitinophagales bacterium]
MLAFIQGRIVSLTPAQVVLEAGGIGYQLHITLNTFSRLEGQSQCRLLTYLHLSSPVQGNLQAQLYGFFDEEERQLFVQMLDVSGIGAATVRLLLSSLTAAEIRQAILTENSGLLERVKGIGPKTAKRLILELKDKVGRVGGAMAADVSVAQAGSATARQEAVAALLMLGYTRPQAEQAVARASQQQPEANTETLVRLALRQA